MHAFQASGADAHPFAVDGRILQIDLLGAFGSDIGMASALGGSRSSSAFFTNSAHSLLNILTY